VFTDEEKLSQAREILKKNNLGLGRRIWVYTDVEWESKMVDMLLG
jgi:hypothetical protein